MASKKKDAKYEDMSDGELAQARIDLDGKLQAIRLKKQELQAEYEKLDAEKKAAQDDDFTAARSLLQHEFDEIRAEKKKIQNVVDSKQAALDPTASSIGVSGIESGEKFGHIGG